MTCGDAVNGRDHFSTVRSEDGWRRRRDVTRYLVDLQNHGSLDRHRVMAENQSVISQQLTHTDSYSRWKCTRCCRHSCAVSTAQPSLPTRQMCHFSTDAGLPLGTTDTDLLPKVRGQFAAGYRTSHKFRSHNRSVREITTRTICQPASPNLQKPKLTTMESSVSAKPRCVNVANSTKCGTTGRLFYGGRWILATKVNLTDHCSVKVGQTVASCVQELISVNVQAAVRRSILNAQVTERKWR